MSRSSNRPIVFRTCRHFRLFSMRAKRPVHQIFFDLITRIIKRILRILFYILLDLLLPQALLFLVFHFVFLFSISVISHFPSFFLFLHLLPLQLRPFFQDSQYFSTLNFDAFLGGPDFICLLTGHCYY